MTNHRIELPDHALARLATLKPDEKWVRCKYCGAKLKRDTCGQLCPTRNCQWEHGVPAANGEELKIVVPFEQQPDGATIGPWYESNGVWRNTPSWPGKRWKCPYRHGDVLVVEGRMIFDNEASDTTCDEPHELVELEILYRLIVKQIEARRVQGLDEDDCYSAGFTDKAIIARDYGCVYPYDAMAAWWNATYARLGPQYEWKRNPYAWVITAAEAAGQEHAP